MKNIYKNTRALLSACLLLLPCAAEAAPKPVAHTETATVAGLPVTVQGGNVRAGKKDGWSPVDLGKDALTPFTALLRAYPNARTVEMSWNEESGAMGGTSADVLFNRVKHTLTVDYSYGGGMDSEYTGTVRFAPVRESVFAAILRAHPKGVPENDPVSDNLAGTHDNNAAAWGGFQYLYQARYGCRAHVLQAEHKLNQ